MPPAFQIVGSHRRGPHGPAGLLQGEKFCRTFSEFAGIAQGPLRPQHRQKTNEVGGAMFRLANNQKLNGEQSVRYRTFVRTNRGQQLKPGRRFPPPTNVVTPGANAAHEACSYPNFSSRLFDHVFGNRPAECEVKRMLHCRAGFYG